MKTASSSAGGARGSSRYGARRSGFRSGIIERMLSAEIRGAAKLHYRPLGLVCMIKAPMAGVQENNEEVLDPSA